MKESILTIPVNEVFEPRSGCPLCRMRDAVEAHICEYIMGAAMMEPDVREETNELGFCFTHYEMLLLQDNRLSLALMLKSYFEVNRDKLFAKKKPQKGLFKKKEQTEECESCFICSKVDWAVNHMSKTIFNLFKNEAEFRKLFSEQEYFCLPHHKYLLRLGGERLKDAEYSDFTAALDKVTADYLDSLYANVSDFCDSFDYRNAGSLLKPGMENVKRAVPRAIKFLTGKTPDELTLDNYSDLN